jgi:hypothetical protein
MRREVALGGNTRHGSPKSTVARRRVRGADPDPIDHAQQLTYPSQLVNLPEFWDPLTSHRPFLRLYRCIFLDSVAYHAPVVLKSLREEVWEIEKHACPRRNELLAHWCRDRANKQFLLPEWIMYHADVAMDLWAGDPNWLEWERWPSVSHGWASTTVLDDRFTMPDFKWDPSGEPKPEAESRARTLFEDALRTYLENMTSRAFHHGLRTTRRNRSRDGRHPFVAFSWLALYQVCGWSYQRIAGLYDSQRSINREAVRKQVHRAAYAIDLPLRSTYIRR